MLDLSVELQNVEVSVSLLKFDCNTDAPPATSKILGTKETLAVESFFGIVIGGLIGQLEVFKRNV